MSEVTIYLDGGWSLGYFVLLLLQFTAKSYSLIPLCVARALCPRVIIVLDKFDGRKGESKWHLPHWDIIRWFSNNGGIFWTRSSNRPKQNWAHKSRSSHHLRRVHKIQRKNSKAGKVLKNPMRLEYIGRKTILWKNRCFCQFALLRCQVLREAVLSQSPTPRPRNTKCWGAVLTPSQETLTCS